MEESEHGGGHAQQEGALMTTEQQVWLAAYAASLGALRAVYRCVEEPSVLSRYAADDADVALRVFTKTFAGDAS
jgi:hypothetical protein